MGRDEFERLLQELDNNSLKTLMDKNRKYADPND